MTAEGYDSRTNAQDLAELMTALGHHRCHVHGNETYNPNAIDQECVDEWLARLSAPGGLRRVLESYRAVCRNAELNAALAQRKLKRPVLTIGAPEFFAHNVEQQMRVVAEDVERAEVWDECGHSLELDQPERLARTLREFMLTPRDGSGF